MNAELRMHINVCHSNTHAACVYLGYRLLFHVEGLYTKVATEQRSGEPLVTSKSTSNPLAGI